MNIIKDLISGGIEGILGSSGKIIDKFVTNPEQKLEAQKMLLDAEMTAKRLEIESASKIRDFAIQYEGSATQVPKGILILRSVIRPIISICMFFSLMFFIGSDIILKTDWLNELPPQYWTLLNIVMGFWFGGKILENTVEKLGSKKK